MLSVNIWLVNFEALVLPGLCNLKIETGFDIILHVVIASGFYDGRTYE